MTPNIHKKKVFLLAVVMVFALTISIVSISFERKTTNTEAMDIAIPRQNWIDRLMQKDANSLIKGQKDSQIINTNEVVSSLTTVKQTVTRQRCSENGGICSTKNQCAQLGGHDLGASCEGEGGGYELTCCILNDIPSKETNILAPQCTETFGGQCVPGSECGPGNEIVGNCWDGGISTFGVCCVEENQLQTTLQRFRNYRPYDACDTSSGMTGNPNGDTFCHNCERYYCARYARDENEVAEKCSSPIGTTAKTPCCYDRDLDGKCDSAERGYCCRTVNRIP